MNLGGQIGAKGKMRRIGRFVNIEQDILKFEQGEKYSHYVNFFLFLRGIVEASTGIVGLDFVSPSNNCLGFNDSSCKAQGNHQLYIIVTPAPTWYNARGLIGWLQH